MIVVTGANGKLGRAIVEQLLDLHPSQPIGISVRDPGKAADLGKRGVRVRHGDFGCSDTLAMAFEGASQVLLVSSNAAASGLDPITQHRTAIAAARAAGVRRIVYTSHMAASKDSAFPPMHTHATTEDMLRASGLAWTALRHGFYASTVPLMTREAALTGVLTAPADGKVSWTTHADLAAAAVTILTREGIFNGPTPPLTAGEALDLDDVATILTDLHGRTIERQVVTDEAYVARVAEHGTPQSIIDITIAMYRAARRGEFETVDGTIAALIGRQPMSLRTYLAARSAA